MPIDKLLRHEQTLLDTTIDILLVQTSLYKTPLDKPLDMLRLTSMNIRLVTTIDIRLGDYWDKTKKTTLFQIEIINLNICEDLAHF